MYLRYKVIQLHLRREFLTFTILMSDKQVSDLKIDRVECPKCGTHLVEQYQHTWSTGMKGDEETLSNLVCSIKDSFQCINPKHKKGHIYGDKDTWDKRKKFIDQHMGSQ